MAKSRFLKLECPRCKHKQVIFSKATTSVKCKKCNYTLNKTGGGKTKLKAKVEDVLWN